MKRGTTLFLKLAVILIGIPVLALCIFFVPELGSAAAKLVPEFAYIQYYVFIVFYASAIPFYFALYQAFKLLSYIDMNKAFSELSVEALMRYQILRHHNQHFACARFAALLFLCGEGRRPRYHLCRIGCSFCFHGDCSLCCCSSKAFTRSHRYKIRK